MTDETMSNKEATNDLDIGKDSLSSLKILEGIGIALSEHTNFVGGEKKFDEDTPRVGDDLNEKTSSTSSKSVEGISDCAEFPISFCFVFEIKGKICKNGMLSLKGNCLGIQINETALDLRKKEYSTKFNVAAEELKIEFYLKDSCLWTKGYLDGWFREKHEWDEKIVDFDEKFNEIKSLTLDSHAKLIYDKLSEYDCADEAAKFMKDNIPGVTDKVLAVALKEAGYRSDEIGNALQKVGCVPDVIVSSLRRAEYSSSEIAKYMKEFIPSMTVDNLAISLKNAGYELNDIGHALNNSHDYAPEVLDKVLKEAGYTGEQIENSFKEMGGKFADFSKDIIDKVKPPCN